MSGLRLEQDAAADGALVVDKPCGPTSHDIVQKVRKRLKTRVGHTGTLDPMASGVLVLLLGRATRLARFLQRADKVYRAVIRLGVTTESYDLEGRVESRDEVPDFSAAHVESALQAFRGEIAQIPPMFSAVRIGGERLYKAARRGETVQREARPVSVHALELMELSGADLVVRISCSAGTYVRVLAHEIGGKLGCGGCLAGLRRLRSGEFRLEDAVVVDELSAPPTKGFRPLETLLPDFKRVDLGDEAALRVRHGNSVGIPDTTDYCRLFHAGRLIAIGCRKAEQVQPVVVFPPLSD